MPKRLNRSITKKQQDRWTLPATGRLDLHRHRQHCEAVVAVCLGLSMKITWLGFRKDHDLH